MTRSWSLRAVAVIIGIASATRVEAGGCTGTPLTSPAQFTGPTTLINFNTYPGGGSVSAGTTGLDDEWKSMGVMIEDSSPGDGAKAYTSTQGFPAHSPPVALADSEGMDPGGFILFRFVVPGTTTPQAVSEAGIWVQNGDQTDNVAFYDCQNVELCSIDVQPATDTFVGLRAPQGIGFILVTGNQYYLTDDLYFGAAVSCGNSPPTITEGATIGLTVARNSTCPGAANQLTLNATDSDGPLSSLNWSIATAPATGTASFVGSTNGGTATVCYQPNGNQQAPDTFMVQVADGSGGIDTITVNVTVTNQAPVITQGVSIALNVQQDSLCPGAPNQVSLSATDADGSLGSLTWTVQTPPVTGSASFVGGSTGGSVVVCYQPTGGQSAVDSFIVRVSDGAATDTIIVNVTVTPTTGCSPAQKGDMNADGVVDGRDAQLFVNTLRNPAGATSDQRCRANIGSPGSPCVPDSTADMDDVPGFVMMLLGGGCNAAPVIAGSDPVAKTVEMNSTCPAASNQVSFSASDSDGPPASLSWSISTPPTSGTASFVGASSGASVTLCYAPTSGQLNPDSFVVRVTDGGGASDTVTVNVTVGNSPPVITQGATASLGVPLNSPCPNAPTEIDLDATDASGNLPALTWSIEIPPATGTVSFVGGSSGASVSVCYQPNPNQTASDSFVIRVSDGFGGIDDITVSVTVNNAPPVITQGNGPLSLGVQINSTCPGASNQVNLSATDPDGNAAQLMWSIQTQGATGLASFVGAMTGASTVVCYQPNGNQTSADSFTILVTDPGGATDSITVNATVNNAPPVITQGNGPLALPVQKNSTCPAASNQVNLSATDADTSTALFAWTIQTPPATGTASFVGGGSGPSVTVCYQPNAGQVASDSFTVRVNDGFGATDSITVNVTVNNAAPVIGGADPQSLNVSPNSTCPNASNQKDLTATDADGDGPNLSWTIQTPPAQGTASFVGGTTGPNVTVCYAPANGQVNPASFVVRVSDGTGGTDTVTINVTVQTSPPVITEGDTAPLSVAKDSFCPAAANQITLNATDADTPPASLTWTVMTPPTHGSASFVGGSSGGLATLCYAPTASQCQADSFVVKVADPQTQFDTITVNVTVLNEAPVIGQGDDPLSIEVMRNSTCPNGNNEVFLTATDNDGLNSELVWSIQTQPATGTISFSGPTSGFFTIVCYQPNPNQNASDSFTVKVTDGCGAMDTIVVNMTVVN